MIIHRNIVRFLAILTVFLFFGCATYYQKSYKFQTEFAAGDLEKAKAFLEKNSKAEEKKDRFLYFLDRGVVEQMLGNFEISNAYFEKAYIYYQDYRKNFGNDLLGMVSNPMVAPYKAEDFETVLIHYYKAINFIHLNDYNAALIEIRRINIRLNELNDQYADKKNRYKEDAFAMNLMGMIYEAKGEINDAFIAYRNANESYKKLYSKEFAVPIPSQLKEDLVRTAGLMGFRQELKAYSDSFNIAFNPVPKNYGSVVLFWLNGLGPVKGEFSLNLTAVKGQGGMLTFANEQEGINLPYQHQNNNTQSNSSDLGDLKVVRMAVPKYRKRSPFFTKAILSADSSNVQPKTLDLGEDVQAIAISTLQDRMLRELAKSIGRVAIKQASELALREKNEELGAVLSVVNAATEKADTRNWQTLPSKISYSRLFLKEGIHTLNLCTVGPNNETSETTFVVEVKAGKTSFLNFHSLESSAPHL